MPEVRPSRRLDQPRSTRRFSLDIDPLSPDTPLLALTSYLATYNLVAAAVVDENDRLVGAVSVDDVLDHLLPKDWRERTERSEARDLQTRAAE